MIEPGDEKLARSDHHSRQGLRKPGDRAKKFNQKNTPKPKQLQNSGVAATSTNRTHGKRVDFINGPIDSPSPTLSKRNGSGGMMGKGSMNEFGGELDDDDDAYSQDDDYEYEEEQRQRAIMVSQGAHSGTGTLTQGRDGIVLDETREAATIIPLEDLLASAYANKKSKKSKADQFDHIRGYGKQQYASVAPKSVKSGRSRRQFPHEEDQDSDWESVGQDGTEAWEYNSEWRAEMGDIMHETLPNKTSYREAAKAAIISVDGSFESESATTERTDELP